MTPLSSVLRAAAAVGATAGVLLGFTPPAVAAPSPTASPLSKTSVRVTVLNLSPTTPAYDSTPQPLTFTLSISNGTDRALHQLNLVVRRDSPLNQQAALESSYDDPPAPSRAANPMHGMVLGDLGPDETRTITYVATASNQTDGSADLCECTDAGIYPIDFTVTGSAASTGSVSSIGMTQTYLPSFRNQPAPVQVSWVWPLIDRPHRVSTDSVFLDDELGISVTSGGRLDRSLQVLEQVQQAQPAVRFTLVVDPELISELLAMSDHYSVAARVANVAGTHSIQAAQWLARFRSVAAANQVEFTPAGDPDTEALVRSKLSWSSEVDAAVAGQATGMGPHDLAWPADGVLSTAGLKALVATGTRSVVLDGAVLPTTTDDGFAPSSLAPLTVKAADGATVNALVTDPTVQRLAATALSVSTTNSLNTSALPKLVASVAMRAAADPVAPHYLAITAPRYVNPSVPSAVRAILETAAATWSTPVTVADAIQSAPAQARGVFTDPVDESSVSAQMLHTSSETSQFVTTFAGTFLHAADAVKVLDGYPAAAQRAASTAWRENDAAAQKFQDTLTAQLDVLRSAVHIIRPANGSYTLASADAPLFVSVVNTLAYPVRVRVKIDTAGAVRGLTTDSIGSQTIQANGNQVTLRVPAHVQRTGRFEVDATLLTPSGATLGDPVRLDVRSTALGKVGVIITVAAGVVLAFALLLRLIRRLRRGPTPKVAQG